MHDGWDVIIEEEKMIQVVPTNDIKEHILEIWCPCKPKVTDICTHNSFDSREYFEPETVCVSDLFQK